MTKELITPSLDKFKECILIQFDKIDEKLYGRSYNPENITQDFMDKYFNWFDKIGRHHYSWEGGLYCYIKGTTHSGIQKGIELTSVSLDEFKECFLDTFNKLGLEPYPNPENITQEFMDIYIEAIWILELKWNGVNDEWKEVLLNFIKEGRITIYDSQKNIIVLDKNSSFFLKECKVLATIKNYEHYIWTCDDGYEAFVLQHENEPFFVTVFRVCDTENVSYDGLGFKKGDIAYYLTENSIYDTVICAIILDTNELVLKFKPYNYIFCGIEKRAENHYDICKIHSFEGKVFSNNEDAEQYRLRRNEKEKNFSQPIQYTIENKNGIYKYSNSFEINGTTLLIRIHILSSNDGVSEIVKQFLIKGEKINFNNYFDMGGSPIHYKDMFITKYLNSTNDLTFDIIENSKIEVTLFPNKHQNIEL